LISVINRRAHHQAQGQLSKAGLGLLLGAAVRGMTANQLKAPQPNGCYVR
jgi:hypothetical protein